MSNATCEQTEATLLWLYGEGDEAHLVHVGSCPVCQALVEEHESVLAATMPVMSAVAPPEPQPVPAPILEAPRTPEPANRPMWLFIAPAVALAAAAVLALLTFGGPSAPTTPGPGVAVLPDPVPPVPVASIDEEPLDALDAGLDDLDAELDDLFADLEAL